MYSEDAIPLLCEPHPTSSIAAFDKEIRLVGKPDTQITAMICALRKKLRVREDESLYFFVHSRLLRSGNNYLCAHHLTFA
jgi:hypothetical protein